MQRGLVAVVVVLAGVTAYIAGAGSRPAPTAPPTPELRDERPRSARDPAQTRIAPDQRSDRLLLDLRASNEALRAAVEELTAEIRLRATVAGAADRLGTEAPTPEQWSERLRAREPDVVLDTVCQLREKMLTRAMRGEARAKDSVGPIVGLLDPEQLRAAQLVQEQNAKIVRDQADRDRLAIAELDSVRTIGDLARWRTKHAEW